MFLEREIFQKEYDYKGFLGCVSKVRFITRKTEEKFICICVVNIFNPRLYSNKICHQIENKLLYYSESH